MKNPKIVNAMNYIDGDMVAASDKVKRPAWTRWSALAACFALVVCSVFAVVLFGNVSASATVAFDVNPSIELEVGKNEKIKEVRALNADAEIVVGDMALEGVDLNVAVNAIVGSMVMNGYLTADRNSILVSVKSENAKHAEQLQNAIRGDIEQTLGKSGIEASVIVQSYGEGGNADKIAKDNHISVAKANLIAKIVESGLKDAGGVLYTAETLAHMNVHELKTLLESKGVTLDGVAASGNTASNYIGKEKALEIALAHAKLTKNQAKKIEIELDYERGVMIYDVEFESGSFEFEYEIHAESGEIVKSEKETDD